MKMHQFLQLSNTEILAIQREMGRPQAGAFVPDGSRRLVLAYSDFEPGSREFYNAAAYLPAQSLFQTINVFFRHELPILFVPILGRSILKRGLDYLRFTALEGLRLLFNTSEWMQLYELFDVKVQIYGNIDCLQSTPCEPAIDWINNVRQQTAGHLAHQLFYAIGESPVVGEKMLASSILFFKEHGRIPTTDEQAQAYYGAALPFLDFFIMTSKMSGLGALPDLLVNGDTEMYYLPTVMGLTERNYRLILYDMLYSRKALRQGITDLDIQPENRRILRGEYERSLENVVGIGFDVGNVWVMDKQNSNTEMDKNDGLR
jgi:hypothetical protein